MSNLSEELIVAGAKIMKDNVSDYLGTNARVRLNMITKALKSHPAHDGEEISMYSSNRMWSISRGKKPKYEKSLEGRISSEKDRAALNASEAVSSMIFAAKAASPQER